MAICNDKISFNLNEDYKYFIRNKFSNPFSDTCMKVFVF